MRRLAPLLAAVHVFHFLATASGRALRTPQRSIALEQAQHGKDEAKLKPWLAKKQWAEKKHRQRTQMMARAVTAQEKPVESCIACFGVQVPYGKYQSEDGDRTDNSYYLFRNPAHKQSEEGLPIIVHFHHGGFFEGAPWKKENKEIKSYLSKGFAVVSVGYRLVTEKYFYEAEDGENKTEELIHVSADGMLSLDVNNRTMDSYKVRVGKQELITKYLYDSTQMIENLISNADKFGLDIHRIVFVGESTGGAGMQYLTWVHHKWNVGRYTPRGMVYHNAQLNYPVHNMLGETWDLFVDSMGPDTKLSDVVSQEACPTIIGNHMCGSPLGVASDYDLCNEDWNKQALDRFCGKALESATLGEVQKLQRWPKDEVESSGAVLAPPPAKESNGFEQLWDNAKNMQKHVPHEPFYLYVANAMNGTRAMDAAHHSVFALNFAKYAEMGKEGAIQYTAYYTDFAHMTEADRGMKRLEVSSAPGDLGLATDLALPPEANGPAAAIMAPSPGPAGPAPASSPAGPAPAPAPSQAPGTTVLNYLSTHNWREDFAGRDVEAGSAEERILYACMAAGVAPFEEFHVRPNKTDADEKKSGAAPTGMSSVFLALATLTFFRCGY